MSRIWEALKHAQLHRRKPLDADGPGLVDRERRRGKRVAFSVPLFIYGHNNVEPFHEETATVIVNSHGALVNLASRVHLGQKLLLTNRDTVEQRECRVVYLEPHAARGTLKGRVAIELIEPAPEFWRTEDHQTS